MADLGVDGRSLTISFLLVSNHNDVPGRGWSVRIASGGVSELNLQGFKIHSFIRGFFFSSAERRANHSSVSNTYLGVALMQPRISCAASRAVEPMLLFSAGSMWMARNLTVVPPSCM